MHAATTELRRQGFGDGYKMIEGGTHAVVTEATIRFRGGVRAGTAGFAA